MMYVWRLQDEDGEGPYASSNSLKWTLQEAHQNCTKHPKPLDDGLKFYIHGYETIFGCSTKKQLKTWFNDGWLDKLQKIGFHPLKFRINGRYVNIGKTHLSFVKGFAKVVSRLPKKPVKVKEAVIPY